MDAVWLSGDRYVIRDGTVLPTDTTIMCRAADLGSPNSHGWGCQPHQPHHAPYGGPQTQERPPVSLSTDSDTGITPRRTDMDQKIRRVLDLGPNAGGPVRTIDITTYGARTGLARRIEIWLYQVDRHWYLTGRPGRRDWYANLCKNPHLIVHLKHGVRADLPATARLISAEDERQRILPRIVDDLNAMERRGVPQFDSAKWIADSPLAEIVFDTPPR